MIVGSSYRNNGLRAHDGSVLKKSDMSFWLDDPKLKDPCGLSLELEKEVTEVEDDVFELMPTLNELWIDNPEFVFLPSEKTLELFRKNRLTVRGLFDTSAEKLAIKYGLRFLHADIMIGRSGNYFEYGVNTAELRFYPDGSACIFQDCQCQGSSAGSSGGGSNRFDLPRDFYLTMSAQQIADRCWDCLYTDIVRKGVLAGLIRKAKAKQGVLLEVRDKR